MHNIGIILKKVNRNLVNYANSGYLIRPVSAEFWIKGS